MLGAPEVLTFGQNFIRSLGGKRALDVGTFTGASALAWALAVPDDGEVYTFDIDHTNYKKFGVPILSKDQKTFQKIKTVEGPAVESLGELDTVLFVLSPSKLYIHHRRIYFRQPHC